MSEDNLAAAKQQCIAQFRSIVEMVAILRNARNADDQQAIEEAEQAIQEDALSVEIRSDWHAVGDSAAAAEFRILLCTGGPAVQIVGELNQWHEPESARMEYQDWFTPWTRWELSRQSADNAQSILLDYARCFYFGEG